MLQQFCWSSADTSFEAADCFAPVYQEVSDDQNSDFVSRLDALPGSYQEVSGNKNSDFVQWNGINVKIASYISICTGETILWPLRLSFQVLDI